MRTDAYLREKAAELERRGVPEARLNLEHLLARRAGLPRLDLLCRAGESLPPDVLAGADADAARLAAGEPLQYILGETPFHGLLLKTDSRALIPRPETEWLVERVLTDAALRAVPAPRIADVGTGTGCIALALAAALPEARLLAIDIDPGALALARENRDRLGLAERVELRQGDLLEGVAEGALDAVVSNPPYIPAAECETLAPHVREREPRRALDGGPDGLVVIRRLVPQAFRCLRPGGSIWLEIGHDQGGAVAAILFAAGFTAIRIARDLEGHERLVAGHKHG